jgi:hypothetical protein
MPLFNCNKTRIIIYKKITMDENKDEDAPVKIYKETPGKNANNTAPAALIEESSEETEKAALKKMAIEKEEAKKDELQKNDTTGEAG